MSISSSNVSGANYANASYALNLLSNQENTTDNETDSDLEIDLDLFGMEEEFNDDYLYNGSNSNGEEESRGRLDLEIEFDSELLDDELIALLRENGIEIEIADENGSDSEAESEVGTPPGEVSSSDDYLYGGNSNLNPENNGESQEVESETLQATIEALRKMDEISAQLIKLNAEAQARKMRVDTNNSIANAYVDSANKANNANTQSGKAINF